MKNFRYSLIALSILIMTGCVQTKYAWHNYDQTLYNHYKAPAEYDQFVESLKEVIEDGEGEGKVPPGIYAEYGFVLYEKGNMPEATNYFKKEHDKWPESRVLMSKMIKNAEKKSTQRDINKETLTNKPLQTTEVAK